MVDSENSTEKNENLNEENNNLDVPLTSTENTESNSLNVQQIESSYLVHKLENLEKEYIEMMKTMEAQKLKITTLEKEIDLLKKNTSSEENSIHVVQEWQEKHERRLQEMEKLERVEPKEFHILKENFEEISKKNNFCVDFIENFNKMFRKEIDKSQENIFNKIEAEWKSSETPKKTYICKKCDKLVKNCYNCLSCSHNFCQSCLNEDNTCPRDKEPTEKRSFIDDSIKKLKGSCSVCSSQVLNGEFGSHVLSFHSVTLVCPGSVLGCQYNFEEGQDLSQHRSVCHFVEILKLKDFQSKIFEYLSQFHQLSHNSSFDI